MHLKDIFSAGTSKEKTSPEKPPLTDGYELEDGLKRYFTEDQLDLLNNTHVFIAGCGGLGSNVAHMLVRSGFRKLTLLDFDVVDKSNLNRQLFFPDQIGMTKTQALAQTLLRLEPDLVLEAITGKIETPSDVATLTNDCDIIVEAFDTPENKAVFVSGAVPTGKPVVSASGIAGYGHTDAIVVRHLSPTLYVVGDGESGIDKAPPLSPRVTLAAAKEADIVLELALNNGKVEY
mgnify:CR=1 FL=1